MSETAIPGNRLLAALPAKEYTRLLPKLERIPLTYTVNIYEPGDVISYVCFPESGIISLLSAVGENSMLEVGIVGSEGIIGLPVFLGVKTINNRAVVQGAGFALWMSTADFLDECSHAGELPRLLQRFTHSLMTQISQSAACYRFHPIEARLARWLLMSRDRMKADAFPITQEFLSNMLGVRREAVSKAATSLQKQKLITYKRGKISILNGAELEAAACVCYKIIKKDFDNFLN